MANNINILLKYNINIYKRKIIIKRSSCKSRIKINSGGSQQKMAEEWGLQVLIKNWHGGGPSPSAGSRSEQSQTSVDMPTQPDPTLPPTLS